MTRYYYGAQNRWGVDKPMTDEYWNIRAFESKKERDAWVNEERTTEDVHGNEIAIRRVLTRKEVEENLGTRDIVVVFGYPSYPVSAKSCYITHYDNGDYSIMVPAEA